MFLLEAKESRSIELIRRYSGRFEKIYVLFSGGKDSLVTLHLVARALPRDRFTVLYTRIPGNTAPQCDSYVERICRGWNLNCLVAYVNQNFWEKFRKAGFPYIGQRTFPWCRQFKYKVWRKLGGKDALYITGVKRSDRPVRKHSVEPFQFVEKWNSYSLAPIWDWTNGDVWAYVEKHGLPLNPLYRIVGHSCNCIYCPYLTKKILKRTLRVFWNISAVLFELILDPPMSEAPGKKEKGMVKGSEKTFEFVSGVLRELEDEATMPELPQLLGGEDQNLECDPTFCFLFFGFHAEAEGGDGSVVVETLS